MNVYKYLKNMTRVKFKPEIYNKKSNPPPLPDEFEVILGSSSGAFDFTIFCKMYPDSKPYIYFMKNIKKQVLLQLLSDHRKGYYCLYQMIDSGKIDGYGCLIPSAMRDLRPQM